MRALYDNLKEVQQASIAHKMTNDKHSMILTC